MVWLLGGRAGRGRPYFTYRLWSPEAARETVGRVRSDPCVRAALGRAIKESRAAVGVTQEELSRRTGLHPTYIADVERGARNPSWNALTTLASGLGTSMEEIGRTYDEIFVGKA